MVKKLPSVSIVTITQFKRFMCLEILEDIIKSQTYKNIIEWIIVEGSLNQEDSDRNMKQVLQLVEESSLNIIYLKKDGDEKLGALRNKGNRKCSGDITVVMDDDDYYPPTRIEHAVDKLSSSNILIAGCSDMYIYDYTLDKFCKFKRFGPNHSINSCMAWKKEYLEHHSHDPEKSTGEESSFTNEFKEPMIQLDPKKTVIQSSHSSNTFNKRELITSGIIKLNESLREVDEPIQNFIPESFFSRMKSIFYKQKKSPYDIVYFAGGYSMAWNPVSKSLSGSEQAIVHLSSEWVKLGKKVAVYGNIPAMNYQGVDYFDWKTFPFDHEYSTVILWRAYGLLCAGPFPLKSDRIWLDLHDGEYIKQFMEAWFRYSSKIHKVFFKSSIQKSLFEKTLRVNVKNDVILQNGVRIHEFSENSSKLQRNPYRFCYTSCYTKGLIQILTYVWPVIFRAEPRAEFHIYYGMEHIQDEQVKGLLKQLLSLPGVMDHGRQTVDLICREKYLSSFHLYISESNAEVDSITIKESILTGTIPLLSTHGIFKERDGIHFEVHNETPITYTEAALKIVELIKNPNLEAFRQQLKTSKSIVPWRDIARQWLDYA
jgi:glycosyltransferase involved in cell wall biosynthesis